jgi:DUF4097 and DUF4098 domain-containing protein YvlB
MKRSAIVLTVLTVLTVPLAGQQKISRRIAIDPDASIRIGNMASNTRLIGWDRDSIAVTGTIPAGTTFFFGGHGRLAKMGVERDEKLTGSAGLGDMEVRVPQRARVWVKALEGWIEVSNFQGEADLVAVGGSITVGGAMRLLTAETLEGSIDVSGASQMVRLKTGGGKVSVSKVTGDLSVSTVGGGVSLLEVEPTTALVETVSGNVVYDGTLNRRATLNVQTHSGNVELRLPRDTGAEFDLHSIDGFVMVSLNPKGPMNKPIRGQPQFFGNAGGGAFVMVRSFKGDIRLIGR